MRPRRLHDWDLSTADARAVQSRLASRVDSRNRLAGRPRLVAGLDISGAFSDGDALAAVVVLKYPGLEIVEIQTARVRPPFPYVPGLLSFREIPVLFAALEKLTVEPDLLVVDGHGQAHPRRFGIASHLGVLFDIPAIGCGKSLLVGTHGRLGEVRGSTATLKHKGEAIGKAVRTRDGVKPVYVSLGHKVDTRSAVRWILAFTTKYRLPEPTRLAHQAASGDLASRFEAASRREGNAGPP